MAIACGNSLAATRLWQSACGNPPGLLRPPGFNAKSGAQMFWGRGVLATPPRFKGRWVLATHPPWRPPRMALLFLFFPCISLFFLAIPRFSLLFLTFPCFSLLRLCFSYNFFAFPCISLLFFAFPCFSSHFLSAILLFFTNIFFVCFRFPFCFLFCFL